MADISATVITYNEADKIRGCLESVKWCDEIVIIDSYSDDGTVDIAREYTDKIYQREQAGYSEAYRELSIQKATNDWVLLVDADERIPNSLTEKIQRVVDRDGVDVIQIPRKNMIGGRWAKGAGLWPGYLLRLFKADQVEIKDEIHSYIEAKDGAFIGRFQDKEENAIEHDAYKGSWDFLKTQHRYAKVKVRQKDLPVGYILMGPLHAFITRYWKGYHLGLFGLQISILFALARFIDGIENIHHTLSENQ
jgi:glycosyltransferase involved in cell wall biosynthesis